MSGEAFITVDQEGVKSFAAAMWSPQHYEVFIDNEKAGELTGYTNRKTYPVTPGQHSVQVRAYARNSVSPTRVYGYSKTITLDLVPGQDRILRCGVLPGPPVRKPLVLTGMIATLLLFTGLGPIGAIPVQARYDAAMMTAMITIAFTWMGHSSAPGANIYLKDSG